MNDDKWPYKILSIQDLFPNKIVYYFQTGISIKSELPISIIDPLGNSRIDPINKFLFFNPFCSYLRSDFITTDATEEQIRNSKWNSNCLECDRFVAEVLIGKYKRGELGIGKSCFYKCYMGLVEIASIVSIDNYQVMVVSGQYVPKEDVESILDRIDDISKGNSPDPKMIDNTLNCPYPEVLYKGPIPNKNQVEKLKRFIIESNRHINEKNINEFNNEVNIFKGVAEEFYQVRNEKLEIDLINRMESKFPQEVDLDSNKFKESIINPLTFLLETLQVKFIVLFIGTNVEDTLLLPFLSVGKLPSIINKGLEGLLFNWRKAKLRTFTDNDTKDQIYNWDEIDVLNNNIINRGIRGKNSSQFSRYIFLPYSLYEGPYCSLLIGETTDNEKLIFHNKFIRSFINQFCTYFLSLLKARMLSIERKEWDRTSQLTGHRIRSSIQSLGNQIDTILAQDNNILDISKIDIEEAHRQILLSFNNLVDISIASEASIPSSKDISVSFREDINIIDIINEAIEHQTEYAEHENVHIKIIQDKDKSFFMFANRFLMRIAFINLINNGIKYSLDPSPGGNRILKISVKQSKKRNGFVEIAIENFGLGIKRDDYRSIFEWGRRVVSSKLFKDKVGKGFGLWEAKFIIKRHGGILDVHSVHFSGGEVTDRNINNCITMFTATLPTSALEVLYGK